MLEQVDRDDRVERVVRERQRPHVADDAPHAVDGWPRGAAVIGEVGVERSHAPVAAEQARNARAAAADVEQVAAAERGEQREKRLEAHEMIHLALTEEPRSRTPDARAPYERRRHVGII